MPYDDSLGMGTLALVGGSILGYQMEWGGAQRHFWRGSYVIPGGMDPRTTVPAVTRPNPFHYRDPSYHHRFTGGILFRSQEAVDTRRARWAMRAFRSDAYTRAAEAYQRGGMPAAWSTLGQRGVQHGLGGPAQLMGYEVMSGSRNLAAGRILAQTAGRALGIVAGAHAIADIITTAGSMTFHGLQEIGRPRDVTPRFYQAPAAMTMRQAGIQAIHSSQMNTRNALGREAVFMHG